MHKCSVGSICVCSIDRGWHQLYLRPPSHLGRETISDSRSGRMISVAYIHDQAVPKEQHILCLPCLLSTHGCIMATYVEQQATCLLSTQLSIESQTGKQGWRPLRIGVQIDSITIRRLPASNNFSPLSRWDIHRQPFQHLAYILMLGA